ncbi:MAG: indole-3-glycerol phosphate synthase TrpC [Prolixibacteraceae bacterium]|jgi:indole-3-glycerol phosphate synthase|nr:indole-3-glycerol phosphate synthase TrpC [Prolixibacteraceae bacterium]MBT6006765.1 indole-3-glycerol phosphate synthase TrpC [Prolixibacteraceae bacterium]MBT6766662.1 indole-3-glycerol phosphate synthase TrpC [Prolixibacteraceae bacterium]MBT6997123.1 indole-3-glycerol phosphate synthase TrpC [Prolixibacteraceae bacterium]MBT7393344.1 indole-3-glycerol phosphate synthase TrpC [Prolixibacteraceae bacterium]
MNILNKIIATKKIEVANQKKKVSVSQLEKYTWFNRDCNSLTSNLIQENSSGVIAEFKQKSPSKGEINYKVKVEKVTKAYADAGAAGLSVLTDFEYFGGNLVNLIRARESNPNIPILRKDFMIDTYQIIEAKAFGADVILLIAACLEKEQAKFLAEKAKSLGMEVLMEIHNEEELEIVNEFVDIVGVNNRNLKSFSVDVETSVNLSKLIPDQFVKISESGLSDAETINYLRKYGFKGFLIGETFMKTDNPGQACKQLISKL